jgi:hypothetical protein
VSSSVSDISMTREELGRRGRAISESEAMQRFHRDVNAGSHHQGLSWDAAAEDFGRQALGLPPAPGRFG